MVGLGMCIRNDAGEFVLAKTTWFALLCDVNVGEVVGIHTSLEWVSNLQFDNVDFSLDSKRIVDQVNSDIDDNNEFGCIISSCRQLLHNNFQNSHVEFNRRQTNEVTHELAHAAPFNLNSHVLDDIPSCIWHILAFFGGGRGLNPGPCIFYALSILTELCSRGLGTF
jgi:ribonuclease HI